MEQGYNTAGWKGVWQLVLDIFEEQSKQGSVSSLDFAEAYAALEEKDQAFEWLEKNLGQGGSPILKVEPRWDPLRSDARFQDPLRRMNFPE